MHTAARPPIERRSHGKMEQNSLRSPSGRSEKKGESLSKVQRDPKQARKDRHEKKFKVKDALRKRRAEGREVQNNPARSDRD